MSWLRPIDTWFAERVFVFRSRHLAYAHKLTGNRDEAEELVQEAYARLFGLENWAQVANPHAFTMRIIHNEAVERFRRAPVVQLGQGASLQAQEPVDPQPLPDQTAFARAELGRLARHMEQLPDRCRQAVHLRKIEGHSPGEVAAIMDISVSTVEKHLVKGLRLLVAALARCDDTSETGPSTECRQMPRLERK